MKWSVIIGSVLLFFSLGLKPLISLAKEKFMYSDIDPQIGQLEVLSDAELTKFYGKHRTLVVGGTRVSFLLFAILHPCVCFRASGEGSLERLFSLGEMWRWSAEVPRGVSSSQ